MPFRAIKLGMHIRERLKPKRGDCIDTDSEPGEIMARATRPIGRQAMNADSVREPSRRADDIEKIKIIRMNRQISWDVIRICRKLRGGGMQEFVDGGED